jgi:pyruvate dehydrogenase E1 component
MNANVANLADTFTKALGADSDTAETREWLDALSSVITNEGPERAHFCLNSC